MGKLSSITSKFEEEALEDTKRRPLKVDLSIADN